MPVLAAKRPDLAALDPLLRRCLAKDPAERFADAAALADELRLAASRLPSSTTIRSTTVLAPPAQPAIASRRVPTAALIAALVLVSAVGIGAAWRHNVGPDPDLVRQRDELMQRLQRVATIPVVSQVGEDAPETDRPPLPGHLPLAAQPAP